MYIISACLLGINCKYSGGNNECEAVKRLAGEHTYVAVCPEVAGGFPVPRPPAEIRNGRIYRKNGEDVTEGFIKGAEEVYKEAQRRAAEAGEEIEMAVLRAKSPSCGAGKIYDGTFTGKITDGYGVFAELLRDNGIKVVTEEDIK